MSIESAKSLLKYLLMDQKFRDTFEQSNVDERRCMLKEAGVTPFTAEEMREALGLAASALDWSQIPKSALQDAAHTHNELKRGESMASSMCGLPLLVAMQVWPSDDSPEPEAVD